MTEKAPRKPWGLSPGGEAGLRWLQPDVLPLAMVEGFWHHARMSSAKDEHKIALSILRETWEGGRR
jgi:hypothetical protein